MQYAWGTSAHRVLAMLRRAGEPGGQYANGTELSVVEILKESVMVLSWLNLAPDFRSAKE